MESILENQGKPFYPWSPWKETVMFKSSALLVAFVSFLFVALTACITPSEFGGSITYDAIGDEESDIGIICGPNQILEQSKCICVNNTSACDLLCVDIQTDRTNCGTCGLSCEYENAVGTCVLGECRLLSENCESGFEDCDGDSENGCESLLLLDSANCGACGNTCLETELCTDGSCGCPDVTTLCDGVCTDLTVDAGNCGECGTSCLETELCVDGGCVCPEGTEICNGVCVDLSTDIGNCGACGTACAYDNAAGSCVEGVCGMTNCDDGFEDCDGATETGCEVFLADDPANCGTCGNACNDPLLRVCSSGACGCGCGNGVYDPGEEFDCPDDYQYTASCGDGFCDANVENHTNCSQDCSTTCGDGSCDQGNGETPNNCSECWNIAGAINNGVCGFRESCVTSPNDCGPCNTCTP